MKWVDTNSIINGIIAIYLSLWPSSQNFHHPTVPCPMHFKNCVIRTCPIHSKFIWYQLFAYLAHLRSPTPTSSISSLLSMCPSCPLMGVPLWWRVGGDQKGVIPLKILLNGLGHRGESGMFQPLCANLPYDSSLRYCTVKKRLCWYKYINIYKSHIVF